MLYCLLCVIIIMLFIRIYLMKKSASEISSSFAERLETDTNTLIDISSHDRDMRNLADSINHQLSILRREHLRYYQGDKELKNAIINISHDLRTPLTAICGYLDMMKSMDKPEAIERYLSIIEERTHNMKLLTEDLFQYSVIFSDDKNDKIEEVLVNKILENSIIGYYGAFHEKGISPEVHITENEIIRNLNEENLSRVFSNLLNNALKYSDGDLIITLSDNGEITFSNTAKELSTISVEQLFDRFYTVEAARNSTGLGLSIARTLVERMGGRITAEYIDNRLIIRIVF